MPVPRLANFALSGWRQSRGSYGVKHLHGKRGTGFSCPCYMPSPISANLQSCMASVRTWCEKDRFGARLPWSHLDCIRGAAFLRPNAGRLCPRSRADGPPEFALWNRRRLSLQTVHATDYNTKRLKTAQPAQDAVCRWTRAVTMSLPTDEEIDSLLKSDFTLPPYPLEIANDPEWHPTEVTRITGYELKGKPLAAYRRRRRRRRGK
jgi:hypothetical protein